MITKFKLFETKIDLDDKYISSLITTAIEEADMDLLNKVLDSDFDFYNNSKLFRMLIYFARNKFIYKDIFERFIDKIDIKWRDTYGKSFLDIAIDSKGIDIDMVKLLIKKGVNVNNIFTTHGFMYSYGVDKNSDYLGKFEAPTIIEYTLRVESRSSYKQLNSYLEVIENLVKGGADLMLKDSEGNCFLNYVNMGALFNYSQKCNDIANKKLKEILKKINPNIIEQLEMIDDVNNYNV